MSISADFRRNVEVFNAHDIGTANAQDWREFAKKWSIPIREGDASSSANHEQNEVIGFFIMIS